MFTNGTFNSNEIEIINLNNQNNVEFTFNDENYTNHIRISIEDWETKTVYYSF